MRASDSSEVNWREQTTAVAVSQEKTPEKENLVSFFRLAARSEELPAWVALPGRGCEKDGSLSSARLMLSHVSFLVSTVPFGKPRACAPARSGGATTAPTTELGKAACREETRDKRDWNEVWTRLT